MKVFAARFLEPMQCKTAPAANEWTWEPATDAGRIYASGNNTNTRQSTYADERDDRGDHDRPNEGLLIA